MFSVSIFSTFLVPPLLRPNHSARPQPSLYTVPIVIKKNKCLLNRRERRCTGIDERRKRKCASTPILVS
ncbi:hypothetical protein KM043_018069 [Ampulex compressa]|nr:hypothetical protein KM043_018069 [Ampulex compressa]